MMLSWNRGKPAATTNPTPGLHLRGEVGCVNRRPGTSLKDRIPPKNMNALHPIASTPTPKGAFASRVIEGVIWACEITGRADGLVDIEFRRDGRPVTTLAPKAVSLMAAASKEFNARAVRRKSQPMDLKPATDTD